MKKIVKKFILALLIIATMFSNISVSHIRAAKIRNPEIKPMLWSGRPGGNGDGSEEFMNGLKYGEMRGPWVYYSTDVGNVYDLLDGSERMYEVFGITVSIVSYVTGFSYLGSILSTVSVASIVSPRDKTFDGAQYFKVRNYGSGRRLKMEFELYNNRWQFIKKVVKYLEY